MPTLPPKTLRGLIGIVYAVAIGLLATELLNPSRPREQKIATPQIEAAAARLEPAKAPAPERTPFQIALLKRAEYLSGRVDFFRDAFAKNPHLKIPELEILPERYWLDVAIGYADDSEARQLEQGLVSLRGYAKAHFSMEELGRAMSNYLKQSGGEMPASTSALLPFLKNENQAVRAEILERYELVAKGSITNLSKEEQRLLLFEKTSPDEAKDQRMILGAGSARFSRFDEFDADLSVARRTYLTQFPERQNVTDLELADFIKPPLSPYRRQKLREKGNP
ncbi:hypothetical protein [Oleiharenicola lentus]|uniref:hypothetical protein n=1 Tax=Oleiharenicola lentus TaxID=2508720 RepID=UPI003F670B61